ncbi:10273_t:CDS:2, partial [Entrophospora sp. SA101]
KGKLIKPYNLILGEQFSCHWDVSEPSEDKGITACGVDQLSARFTRTSVKIGPGEQNKGIYINLSERRNEEYLLTHSVASVQDWLKAPLYVVVAGSCIVTCPKTKLKAVLEYKEEIWKGYSQFQKKVKPISKQRPLESCNVWKPVTTVLFQKDYTKATKEKQIIEERQRQKVAEYKSNKEFNAAYFKLPIIDGKNTVVVSGGGVVVTVFGGGVVVDVISGVISGVVAVVEEVAFIETDREVALGIIIVGKISTKGTVIERGKCFFGMIEIGTVIVTTVSRLLSLSYFSSRW